MLLTRGKKKTSGRLRIVTQINVFITRTFTFRDPVMWRAVLGSNNINGRRPPTKIIKVKAIIIHPNFSLETYVNDIALFRLKKAVKYNNYIQPICLPFDVFQRLDEKTECFIGGWGRTSEGGNYSLNFIDTVFFWLLERVDPSLGIMSLYKKCSGFSSKRINLSPFTNQ